jgi:hypothetical protein
VENEIPIYDLAWYHYETLVGEHPEETWDLNGLLDHADEGERTVHVYASTAASSPPKWTKSRFYLFLDFHLEKVASGSNPRLKSKQPDPRFGPLPVLEERTLIASSTLPWPMKASARCTYIYEFEGSIVSACKEADLEFSRGVIRACTTVTGGETVLDLDASCVEGIAGIRQEWCTYIYEFDGSIVSACRL